MPRTVDRISAGTQNAKEMKMGATATKTNVKSVGEKKKKKKEKKERPQHPLIKQAAAKGEKLKELPGDFDFEQHEPLKKSTFDADWKFFDYKAREFRHRADVFDARAAEAKKHGTKKDRNAISRLKKMQDKMSELMDKLREDGVDVDAVLADMEED